MRQMTLVAILQAQKGSDFVGSWRHPDAAPDFTSVEYGRLGSSDDWLALPDRDGGNHAHRVANGIRCVKMDPVTILAVMGMAIGRLGLMTGGRAAWNAVPSPCRARRRAIRC